MSISKIVFLSAVGCAFYSQAMVPPIIQAAVGGRGQAGAPAIAGGMAAPGMPVAQVVLPAVLAQHQQAQVAAPVALPSTAVVSRQKKIRTFFDRLKVADWLNEDAIKTMLTNDPWLLNERDPSAYGGAKIAIVLVAERWLSKLDRWDARGARYYWDSGDDWDDYQGNFNGVHHYRIYKHMLSLGKNDATFINQLGPLKAFLLSNTVGCQKLVDRFKLEFPNEQLAGQQVTAQNIGQQAPAVDVAAILARPRPAQPAVRPAVQLTDDQKAALVLDIFDTVDRTDFSKSKRLIASHPWLVDASNEEGDLLLLKVVRNCRSYRWSTPEETARIPKRREFFAFLLLKGADPLKVEPAHNWTTQRYLQISSEYSELEQDLNDFLANRQTLLNRYPSLDENRVRIAQAQGGAQAGNRQGAGPAAQAGAQGQAQQQQQQPPQPRRRGKSFWNSWKPWIIGGVGIVGAAAWWYKYRYNRPPVEIILEEEDAPNNTNNNPNT